MSALWLAMAVTSTSTSGLTLSLHEPSSSVRCAHNKTIHFVRHAEGWHNVDELEAEAAELWKTHPQGELRSTYGIAWMLLKQVSGDKYLDPLLTPKGREQSYALRSKLRAEGTHIDAVALSPMRRTIETALLGLPELESAATAVRLVDPRSGHNTPPTLPLLATDLLRERCAHFMPDSRLTRTELEKEYSSLGGNASINFSQISDADQLFADGRERHEPEVGSKLLASRAADALEWLSRLPTALHSVAVVSHKHFLGALTSLGAATGVEQRPFENAEMRTLLLCASDPPPKLADSKVVPRDAAVRKQEL